MKLLSSQVHHYYIFYKKKKINTLAFSNLLNNKFWEHLKLLGNLSLLCNNIVLHKGQKSLYDWVFPLLASYMLCQWPYISKINKPNIWVMFWLCILCSFGLYILKGCGTIVSSLLLAKKGWEQCQVFWSADSRIRLINLKVFTTFYLIIIFINLK